MTVLAFVWEAYEARGGLGDLVGVHRSEWAARRELEGRMKQHQIEAQPALSIEELEERRRRGMTTSDMRPITKGIPARPRRLECDTYAVAVRLRRGGNVESSWCRLIDDGDWCYHYEWSEWETVTL